jgi:hypothetical protein
LGTAATVLIGLTTLAFAAVNIAEWNSYRVVRDFVAGENAVAEDDLDRADLITGLLALLSVALLVFAAAVFLWWLRRARVNSELLAETAHRHSRGWVIGAWFCPIVNLWFPKQIVDDIWRGSDPARRGPSADAQTGGPTSPLTLLWWLAWISSNLIDWFVLRLSADSTVDALRTDATVSSVSTLLTAVAGVTVAVIIRRITGWQSDALRQWSPQPTGPQSGYPYFHYQQPGYPPPYDQPQSGHPPAAGQQPSYGHPQPGYPYAYYQQPRYGPPSGGQQPGPPQSDQQPHDRPTDHEQAGGQPPGHGLPLR